MKKFLPVFGCIFLLTGCGNGTTPTSPVTPPAPGPAPLPAPGQPQPKLNLAVRSLSVPNTTNPPNLPNNLPPPNNSSGPRFQFLVDSIPDEIMSFPVRRSAQGTSGTTAPAQGQILTSISITTPRPVSGTVPNPLAPRLTSTAPSNTSGQMPANPIQNATRPSTSTLTSSHSEIPASSPGAQNPALSTIMPMPNLGTSSSSTANVPPASATIPPLQEPALAPGFTPNLQTKGPIGNIHFDQKIDDRAYSILARDLYALRQMSFEDPVEHTHEWMVSLFGLPNHSTENVVRWLEDRVQFIVGLGFDPGFGSGNRNFVAWNYGATRYKSAKNQGWSHDDVEINNLTIIISSPRTGIMMAGEDLYEQEYYRGVSLEISRSITRLGTLYHEARHSDGNGDSLCFSHIRCPDWHPYAGSYACDDTLNGSYTIGGEFVNVASRACQNCSEAGKQSLALVYADQKERVLAGEDGLYGDPTPEGTRIPLDIN